MKKSPLSLFGFALLISLARPLFGQGGSTDSPENPTAVLAIVGSAGALFASVRARINARRSGK